MMDVWSRIVGGLLVLIVILFLVQWILPRGPSNLAARRHYLRRDIAPILGFFGILILALSLAEAVRRDVIPAWGWGIALGMLVSVALGALWNYRKNRTLVNRSLWYYVRRFGSLVVAVIIGMYLAVRVFGVSLQVFVASTLGVVTLALAIFIFTTNAVNRERLN